MNKENKKIFIKRLESFAWRLGMVCLAGVVSFLADNLGLFQMPSQVTLILGLILGEISKAVSNIIKETK